MIGNRAALSLTLGLPNNAGALTWTHTYMDIPEDKSEFIFTLDNVHHNVDKVKAIAQQMLGLVMS